MVRMNVDIVNRVVPGLPVLYWARGIPSCVVLHETANPSDHGSYVGEINFMANHWESAFYHLIAGEENTALLHDPDIGGAWGAGPSMHHYAIHIELVRSDNKEGFLKAYKNWIGAAVYYAKKYDIPINFNVGTNKRGFLTHHYVERTFGGTTHTDPDAYLAQWGISIAQLERDIDAAYEDGEITAEPVEPSQGSHPSNVDWYSVVNFMNAHGMDSSFDHRSQLAKQYGIDNYSGTADQNIELLHKLMSGKPKHKSNGGGSHPVGDMDTNSIVEYLNSIGEDSSYSHRENLAHQYGINNYSGTAEQNLLLLEIIRDGSKHSSHKSKPKGDMDTDSIVKYLNSIGENSSYSHREDLARQYGIDNYRGTAEQNLELLDRLRGNYNPPSHDSNNSGKAIVPFPGYNIKLGSNDRHNIERIQRALRSTGADIGVDGYFGPNTREAVMDYQRDHNLTVDGIVGPATWNELF